MCNYRQVLSLLSAGFLMAGCGSSKRPPEPLQALALPAMPANLKLDCPALPIPTKPDPDSLGEVMIDWAALYGKCAAKVRGARRAWPSNFEDETLVEVDP